MEATELTSTYDSPTLVFNRYGICSLVCDLDLVVAAVRAVKSLYCRARSSRIAYNNSSIHYFPSTRRSGVQTREKNHLKHIFRSFPAPSTETPQLLINVMMDEPGDRAGQPAESQFILMLSRYHDKMLGMSVSRSFLRLTYSLST